jgi:hypothetical protein
VALLLFNGKARAAGASNSHFKAVAFNYFVIVDPNSVVPEVGKAFPGKGLANRGVVSLCQRDEPSRQDYLRNC